MSERKLTIHSGILMIIVMLAALSRLLPHPPNVTPIGAMALFGAAYFARKWLAILIPLAAIWISNILLDNFVYASMYPEYYEGFTLFSPHHTWQFLGFLFIALMGMGILSKINLPRLVGASISASLIFFLVTNFGTWMSSGMYPANLSGLLACYAAGIPYFWNTLGGDLLFVGLLFGAYEWVRYRYPKVTGEYA